MKNKNERSCHNRHSFVKNTSIERTVRGFIWNKAITFFPKKGLSLRIHCVSLFSFLTLVLLTGCILTDQTNNCSPNNNNVQNERNEQDALDHLDSQNDKSFSNKKSAPTAVPLLSEEDARFLNIFHHLDLINTRIKEIKDNSFFESKTVKTIAHRGDIFLAPQCTEPAYILARRHGHSIVENDLNLSEDNEFVMWHDTTLSKIGNLFDINGYLLYTDGVNKTDFFCVAPHDHSVYTWNGTEYVPSSVPLSSLIRCNGSMYGVNSKNDVIGLPLSVLKRIDFGVYRGNRFKGTQILTFEEWCLLCKKLGMEIYIDNKISYTEDLLVKAANIVKKCGMGNKSSWLSVGSLDNIALLRSIIPDARVGVVHHPTKETVSYYKPANTGRGFFFHGNAKNGMTKEIIQLGLNAGYEVEVWYVGYPEGTSEEQIFDTVKTAVSYGVTGISLDHYRVDEIIRDIFDKYE